MAVYNRGGVTTSTTPRSQGYVNEPHTSSSSSSGRDFTSPGSFNSHLSETANKVIQSVPYRQAYELLSKASDPVWLLRLEAIPFSVDDANSTWFDEHNLSNKYNDKQDANYQYCMEQIQALVLEYQTWVNSLPKTQVQQFADAGINSAITGQGVNGSELNPQSVSTDPSSLSSTEPIEIIGTIGNLIFDGANGILSAIQTFNQIGVSRSTLLQADRTSHWNIQKDLMSLGFTSFPKSSSVQDFNSWWSEFGSNEAKSLSLGDSAINQLRSRMKFFEARKAEDTLFDFSDDAFVLSQEGQDLVNSLVSFELDTWQLNFKLKNAQAKYNAAYQMSLDPSKMAEYAQNKAQYDADISKYQSEINRIQYELDQSKYNAVNEWLSIASTDRQARAILARVLMNISPQDFARVNNIEATTTSTLAVDALQPVGQVVNIVK